MVIDNLLKFKTSRMNTQIGYHRKRFDSKSNAIKIYYMEGNLSQDDSTILSFGQELHTLLIPYLYWMLCFMRFTIHTCFLFRFPDEYPCPCCFDVVFMYWQDKLISITSVWSGEMKKLVKDWERFRKGSGCSTSYVGRLAQGCWVFFIRRCREE